MGGRRYEFRAASEARDPILCVFSDGREFEFPGDVNADAWLSFFEDYGDRLTGNVIPVDVVGPMYRCVFGDEYGELRKQLMMSELREVAAKLFNVYAGLEGKGNDDEDDDPEESANPQ